MSDTDYSHAAHEPTHAGDVCCDPEPTAGQMRRFRTYDPVRATHNIMRLLADGPATAGALREMLAHSEQTIARVLAVLSAHGHIVRRGRRWALAS